MMKNNVNLDNSLPALDKHGRVKGANRKSVTITAIIQVILTILAIIWIIPFVYIVLHSFRGSSPSVAFPTEVIPTKFTLDNYIMILGGKLPENSMYNDPDLYGWLNFPRWWTNTLIISIFSCLISSFYVLATSYAFSRMRFKLRQPMMRTMLILGMFPGFLGMIAVYHILKALGLNEGYLKMVALILVYSGGAGMGYYIAKGFFDTIPRSLDESARIDGANRAQVFWKIIIPSSKPIIVYTVLMAFMGPWMDFIFVKIIVVSDLDFATVSLGLWEMLDLNKFNSHWVLFCAGATLVATPITVLFMWLQKYYVSGVTGGAVKG